MKAIILVLVSLLLLGCAGGEVTGNVTGNQTQKESQDGILEWPGEVLGCEPSYSVSSLGNGVLGQPQTMTVTMECAEGKTVAIKIDGELAVSGEIETSEQISTSFQLTPAKDGDITVTVESDGVQVSSQTWAVAPLGSSDIKGLDNDGISFKEWRAISFDVGGRMAVGKVRAYMKRLEARTQPGTSIIVEIASDDGGKPGSTLASVKRPINVTTLTENWISFEFADSPQLSAGKYWVVFKIEQTESVDLISDKVYIHNMAVDKQTEGNDYTRQMILSVDTSTGVASETSWAPLSYDRYYSVTIHGEQ